MNARQQVSDSKGNSHVSSFVAREMPRSANANVYYMNFISDGILGSDARRRGVHVDVWVAAAALVASLVVMFFNFPVGTIVGMPAFAYLLAASKGK